MVRYAALLARAWLSSVVALARSAGVTAGQLAINWVIGRPGVASALVGVKNARQIEDNLGAMGWSPSPEIAAELNEVFARA